MSVVTIRGQLGSGSPEIGRLVAERLYFDYVDREIIAEVVERRSKKEQDIIDKEIPSGSFLGNIAEALGHTYPDCASYTSVCTATREIPLDDTGYLTGLKSVIRDLAGNQSVVIQGHGSQFILRDYPGALHVLVVAPLEVRIKRVMESMKLDETAAKKEIARFDTSHLDMIKKYFQADLEDPRNYDLVINTEHLSFEATASIIVDALIFRY